MSEKIKIRHKRRIRSFMINPRYQLKCASLTAATGALLVTATVAILFVFIRENFIIWAGMTQMSDDLQLRLNTELRHVIWGISWIALVWIALICLFSVVLTHRTAGPLYHFQRVFDEIRAGKFDTRIRLRPHDEFHEVAQSFNSMMETLLENQEKTKSETAVDAEPVSVLDENGFGLVDVIVAAGIGSVIMLSMSTMMSNMSNSLRGSRTVASRDQLMTRIGREATNVTSLQASFAFTGSSTYPGFPSNAGSMFYNCVNGAPPNGCVAKDSSGDLSYGFTLTDSFSSPIAGPGLPMNSPGAATDANAAVYDVNGALCANKADQAPSATCQILVTTTFSPKCSNNQSTCAQASSITINYTLAQASGITSPSGMGLLSLKPITQPVTLPVPFAGITNGVPKYLAKWISNTQIGVSSIFEDTSANQYIGIGTSTPSYKLDFQEVRTDTSGLAYSMVLTQKVKPASSSTAWFVPLLVLANSSGTNQDLNSGGGTTAILGETNWSESSATVNSAYGVDGAVRSIGTGTIVTGYGVEGKVDVYSGTVQVAKGVQGRINSLGPNTITEADAGYFEVYQAPSGGASLPGTGYGVRIGPISATNKWSLYAGDNSAPSYFAGKVGIGTTTPAQMLDVAGNIAINGTSICSSSGCTSSSDRALKENIRPLQDSLEKVLKLQGVEYDYKDKTKFTDKHQIGVIAQDVEKIFPEVVLKDSKTGLRSVAYDHLVAPLIEAFKSLYERVVAIGSHQTTQDRELASLKADNKRLRQENTAIVAYLCSKDQAAPFCR